jgi:Zn-finger nucleic acid-binding protein
MECRNCGAPLPLHSDVCEFCRTLNDTDTVRLAPKSWYWGAFSHYLCPRCNVPLRGVTLDIGTEFDVLRCEKCLGFFFSPHTQLAEILEVAVPALKDIDFTRLANLVDESQKDNWPVTYIKCPICENQMHRRAYGQLSGVIVDTCKDHGIWLDGGEFGKLIRWARSGGREADDFRKPPQEFKGNTGWIKME